MYCDCRDTGGGQSVWIWGTHCTPLEMKPRAGVTTSPKQECARVAEFWSMYRHQHSDQDCLGNKKILLSIVKCQMLTWVWIGSLFWPNYLEHIFIVKVLTSTHWLNFSNSSTPLGYQWLNKKDKKNPDIVRRANRVSTRRRSLTLTNFEN